MKYLEINITKYVKVLYAKNYKTLTERIKKTYINGMVYHANGLEDLKLLLCQIPQN
jgi:hypothetical protein